MKFVTVLVFLCSLVTAPGLASAHEVEAGNLVIMHPVIRATPAGAPVSAGYLEIVNSGDSNDRLVAASVEFAGKVQIHDMKMEEGIMKMRPIAGGVIIPAGGTVVLKPGGKHIMFMKLAEQMEAGTLRTVILEFENAGKVEVPFFVDEIEPNHDHSGHTN